MDTPARRSGIPIPKTKSNSLKKNISKSNDNLLSDSIELNNQSGELDLFTLLEENIALKEKIEDLLAKQSTILQKNIQLERDNSRVGKQFNDLKVQQKLLKDQLQGLMDKFQREVEEGQTIHNIQEQQKKIINDLMLKVQHQEEKHLELLKTGKLAKNRLEVLAPDIRLKENYDETKCDIVTTETVEQLINEIGKIKTQMNNTELQLYEANEKIAELIDNHQHLKDENENLKVENSNLTKVARLMTRSMQESMETNKKMEEALIEMKKRNNELAQENKDAIDSPTSPKFFSTNDQVMHLKEELKRREAAHTERIVEMNKLMETTIETNNNDEINLLRIKLEIVEKDLQIAISRAEKAENELKHLKNVYKNSIHIGNALAQSSHESAIKCLHCGNCFDSTMQSTTSIESSLSSAKSFTSPPPPPPPLPNFKPIPFNLTRCDGSLMDGITSFTLNNPRDSGDNISICSIPDVKKSATGMDALIAELRDRTVTLRRNRQKTQTNAALQEMFETLELSRKQNRNSRTVMESHRT